MNNVIHINSRNQSRDHVEAAASVEVGEEMTCAERRWWLASIHQSEKSRAAGFSMSVEDDYTRVGHSFFHSHETLRFA